MTGAVPTRDTLLIGRVCYGSTAEIDAVTAYAAEVLRDADEYVRLARLASAELAPLSSAFVRKLEMKVSERLVVTASTLVQSCRSAVQALRRFSTSIGEIHARANLLALRVDEHLEAVRWCMQEIHDIAEHIQHAAHYDWNQPPHSQLPNPVLGHDTHSLASQEQGWRLLSLRRAYEADWWRAATRWQQAVNGIASAASEWCDLVERRRTAESMLLRELSETAVSQLIALGAGGGITHKRTIATAFSGEIWGETVSSSPGSSHPLLRMLIGSTDGSHIWQAPPAPTAVASSWAKLSEHQRERLISEVPWVIGNLPGIPFSVRDRANRMSLAYYIAMSSQLSADSQQAVASIVQVIKAEGAPKVSLVALNLEGRVPLAAVGYGDLDHAHHLVWEVPGMFNDVNDGLQQWDSASRNLFDQQQLLLTQHARREEGIGVIAFFEYDTPNLLTVLSSETARDSAGRLALELQGTWATRAANTPLPNLAVLGHSYGTTVASNALAAEHLLTTKVSSYTMIGSAGLDATTVKSLEQLQVSKDSFGRSNIFTTMAPRDELAPIGSLLSGRLQPNPESAASRQSSIGGAYQFSSNGIEQLTPTEGHSILLRNGQGYLDKNTQSLYNLAAITTGQIDLLSGPVTVAEQREPADWERMQRTPAIGWR